MQGIRLSKVNRNSTRSCNNCTARNFEGFLNDGKVVYEMYDLQISNARITLCEDCLQELKEILNAGQKMTNYDRIKNMTVEELAGILCHAPCVFCKLEQTQNCAIPCAVAIKQWLESEVTEE